MVGKARAFVELGHRQQPAHAFAHHAHLGHAGDRVEAQVTLPAEHADVVVQHVLGRVVEGNLARPVQFLAGGVIARRHRPAHQVERAVAGLLAFGIGVADVALHVAEQFVVIDLVRVLIGHVTVIGIGDHDRPAVIGGQCRRTRHDQAQHAVVGRIAPHVFQHAAGVGLVQILELVVQVEMGLGLEHIDLPGTEMQ
ncbi:hypothetical protein D3C71_1282080 [compost metagenome]